MRFGARHRAGPAPHHLLQVELRLGADQRLGQRRRHGQEVPVEPEDRRPPAGRQQLELLDGRDDVEGAQPLDPGGVVERQPVGDPPAAVVADDGEALVAERRHQGDDVGSHRALGVHGVLVVVGRRARAAVAPQVGHDHGVLLGQRRGDAVPAAAVLRVAVQQHHRRARAGGAHVQRDVRRRPRCCDSWKPSIVTRSVDHVVDRRGDPELLAAVDADELDVARHARPTPPESARSAAARRPRRAAGSPTCRSARTRAAGDAQ